MLKVLIDCNDHQAIFDLPHKVMGVGDYLCSAGFWNLYADLQLQDDDDPSNVQVKLIAETAADNYLQSLFPQDARLSDINTVCDLFYRLPAEQQADLTHSMAAGIITDDKDLLDVIKGTKSVMSHDLPAITFSRVKLYTDDGEEAEFFMGGVPDGYEDIEDHEECIDFKEFLEQTPDSNLEGITAFITTFTEGDGDPQPADKADIERIYNAIENVDIDTITGWRWVGENSFTFDYDAGEQFGITDCWNPSVRMLSEMPMFPMMTNLKNLEG